MRPFQYNPLLEDPQKHAGKPCTLGSALEKLMSVHSFCDETVEIIRVAEID